MDLINTFLNLVAPPFTFFSLCFLLPPYLIYKGFSSVFNFIFSEDVTGKVVLITGASSGIGEHLAYEYAKRGACLALVARREKRLRDVVYRAEEYGSPDVLMILADVQKVDDCNRLVEETISHFGRLDHLVNNAGISSAAMLEEITDITTFRTIMDTNFWGSAYITHFAVPYLRGTRGKIIVIASSASWLPSPRFSIYNASKAALVAFFETLRVELGSDIHVLIVTPGFIESELTQGKFLLAEGKVDLDQDARDVQVSAIPVQAVTECARSIVNSARRGDKYLTEPKWFRMTWIWKVFCPDAIEWNYRLSYLPGEGEPAAEAPSKKVLDMTGAKKILYPESIQMPELKTD
ncbi:11-beta-hydroxysteroid dehydrogenase A [Ricinus communis]|uniref:Corticosteroid 11-beta-dehydrogenase, putative n=1 Tax=Ricinus communis TaxID=3988 RepID=B9RAC0_RICCO|nr:11-beta-hydroxysteroid dehydrogenase A [Ricinus communis]EEF51747.1 Corticosteroid 11-beta-dehydrogenase, putative [Ricinus communis]|eukprot:XP_002511145.1 11-beta-hydroxysteroid dehydrogenase 1B [Ricinus communis]